MAWEFLDEPHWVEYARSPFPNRGANDIQKQIVLLLRDYFPRRSGISQVAQQYHGHNFLRDIPNRGQAAEAAWFGFVDTHQWLKNYNRGYDTELVIAYREHKKYRLDGSQFGDQFICISAANQIVGGEPVKGQVAWIVNFDETWNQEIWENLFEEVRKIGR